MKKIVLFIGILSFMVSIGCQLKSKPLSNRYPFLTDFETAKAEAIKTNKPMIIDFYTDKWCKWCHAARYSLTFAIRLSSRCRRIIYLLRSMPKPIRHWPQRYGIRVILPS